MSQNARKVYLLLEYNSSDQCRVLNVYARLPQANIAAERAAKRNINRSYYVITKDILGGAPSLQNKFHKTRTFQEYLEDRMRRLKPVLDRLS